jgi:signal transduction histidine kinase
MVDFYTLVSLASLFILAFLLTRLWVARDAPGALELLLCTLSCAVWSIGYILEILVPGLAGKIFWAKFQYLGIATVPVWVLLFIFRYCGLKTFFSVRYMLALLVIPALTVAFTATNEMHRWMWVRTELQPNWATAPLAIDHGWWFWITVSYGYIMLVMGTILLVRFVIRAQRLYLSQTLLMLCSMFIPWVGNALYVIGIRPGPNLDLTPIAFTLTNIGLVIGFISFRLLDILPVAYSSIFQFMGDGVIVLDAQGRVVDINPAARRIFSGIHLSPPTQPGVQDRDGDDPFIGQKMEGLLPGWSDAVRDEREFNLGSGALKESRVYSLRTTSILNRRQQVTGQVLLFADITKLKRAEEQMKQAHEQEMESNRLKTQLLANVSHDMRTPLGAITGYAEMLRAGVYGPISPEQNDALLDIHDSANELLLFVNNLISQAQFDTGKILFKPKLFPVTELVEACRITATLPASRKGLSVEYVVDPSQPAKLYGDPYWLRQIVLNLVDNAVKFTDHGSVKVRLYLPDPQHWAIEVSDTGIGIPEAARSAIFEPFRQMDGSMTRERSGSGLGLAIVKELTDIMGGTVRLDSQPGAGSTFTVCFPYLPKERNQ